MPDSSNYKAPPAPPTPPGPGRLGQPPVTRWAAPPFTQQAPGRRWGLEALDTQPPSPHEAG